MAELSSAAETKRSAKAKDVYHQVLYGLGLQPSCAMPPPVCLSLTCCNVVPGKEVTSAFSTLNGKMGS